MVADQRRAPARGAVGDGGLGAIECLVVHGRSWIGAELDQAAARRRRPAPFQGRDFRRLAHVKEQNVGLAASFLASSGLMRGTLAFASSSLD
jgi:hypothetical protein